MSIETALTDLNRAIADANLQLQARGDQILRDHGSDLVGTSTPEELYTQLEMLRATIRFQTECFTAQQRMLVALTEELITLRDHPVN